MKLLAKWACTLFAAGVAMACSAANEVRDIYMALDSSGARPRTIFYTDTSQISCNLDWVGRNPDTTIDALIVQTYHEDPSSPGSGSLVAFAGAIMAAGEQVGTEGVAQYSFTWTPQSSSSASGGAAPFPVGRYDCRLSVNGQDAGKTSFEIQYPPIDANGHECPAENAATPGAQCAGWVKPGATCPSAADLAQMCVCGGANWSCQ